MQRTVRMQLGKAPSRSGRQAPVPKCSAGHRSAAQGRAAQHIVAQCRRTIISSMRVSARPRRPARPATSDACPSRAPRSSGPAAPAGEGGAAGAAALRGRRGGSGQGQTRGPGNAKGAGGVGGWGGRPTASSHASQCGGAHSAQRCLQSAASASSPGELPGARGLVAHSAQHVPRLADLPELAGKGGHLVTQHRLLCGRQWGTVKGRAFERGMRV
jgi:hypothetical protein